MRALKEDYLVCMSKPVELTVMEDETILYSPLKNEYFGISGAAEDILKLTLEKPTGITVKDILMQSMGEK
jgi:hypothetical protein